MKRSFEDRKSPTPKIKHQSEFFQLVESSSSDDFATKDESRHDEDSIKTGVKTKDADAERLKISSKEQNLFNMSNLECNIVKPNGAGKAVVQKKPTKRGRLMNRTANDGSNQTLITSFFRNPNPQKQSLNSTSLPHPKLEGIDAAGSSNISAKLKDSVKCEPIRTCPFYKKIPGTSFVVDAFSYGCIQSIDSYFLSHFHYDHYNGLDWNFHHNIYCSQITSSLIALKIGVNQKHISVLPLYKPCKVNNVQVTLFDAHHCPGAVMFLFKLPDGQTLLHTGDFRASPAMESYSQLKCRINQLYLDTTYCDPCYDFPTQDAVLDRAVSIVNDELSVNPATIVVCGSYTIGKEKVFISVAESLKSKIAAHPDKLRVLRCLELDSLKRRLTQNWCDAQVHVLPMTQLKCKTLMNHLSKVIPKYNKILAIRPTGWVYDSNSSGRIENIKLTRKGCLSFCALPYSEHSSFSEMKRFVQFIRPNRVIATVNNGNVKSRERMQRFFKDWLN